MCFLTFYDYRSIDFTLLRVYFYLVGCILCTGNVSDIARDKGLVTNYGEGGLQNGREGNRSFTPTKKGGRKCFEIVLMWELEVLAILMGGGGRLKFPPLRGCKQFYPVSREGGAKRFGPAIFSFCSPPPHK